MKTKSIKEWQDEISRTAIDKGWWEDERNPLELMMLMVSELAEACEECRIEAPPVYGKAGEVTIKDFKKITDMRLKPEGEAVELIDCIIRILDYFGHKGWDAEKILRLKVKYNKTRPYRHGGKKY